VKTPEQFRARLDAAIERSRTALDELIALRRDIAGEGDDGLTEADRREIAELVAKRAPRMRARGGGL
jgi:hypothetical protein